MSDINRVIISGRLTKDSEVYLLPSDTPSVSFRIASSRFAGYDPQGKPKMRTQFFDVQWEGRRAEAIQQFLLKGRWVYIEGELRTFQSEAMKAQGRPYATVIHASDVNFAPRAQEGAQD